MPRNPIPEVNNLFLLGAGFTKTVFDYAPLNDDLLEKLISCYPQSPMAKYQCCYHTRNIEVLLTRLDLETVESQSERLWADRQEINKEIAEYFQQFRFGRNKQRVEGLKWLKRFGAEVVAYNDVIISLNYDCLLEGALDYYKVWSPSRGYGATGVEVEVPRTDFEKLPRRQEVSLQLAVVCDRRIVFCGW